MKNKLTPGEKIVLAFVWLTIAAYIVLIPLSGFDPKIDRATAALAR